MVDRTNTNRFDPLPTSSQHMAGPVGFPWLAEQFDLMQRQLASIEMSIEALCRAATDNDEPVVGREYYSVPEFAELVGRKPYTVRERCRLGRIDAEKCETGRGDAKNWKIAAKELARYRDHGLRPL